MKLKHSILLLGGSIFTVAGSFLKITGRPVGEFVQWFGIGIMIVFIITFYKHLKSKNETTSK